MSVYTRIIVNSFSRHSQLGHVLGWMRQCHTYARLGRSPASRPILYASELLRFHKRKLSLQFLCIVLITKFFSMKHSYYTSIG